MIIVRKRNSQNKQSKHVLILLGIYGKANISLEIKDGVAATLLWKMNNTRSRKKKNFDEACFR